MNTMLTVKVRDGLSPTVLRKEGYVPAVFYGAKVPATPIAVEVAALERTWHEAGETTIVTLTGAGADVETLIKDVQTHPVTGGLLHADFYVLEKGKKVSIAVPLSFVGEAPAEKQGGVVVKSLHEIEIEVVPAELPHALDVDMTKLLEIGSHITAGDIALPPSAVLVTDAEEIVASATHVQEEKEELKVEAALAEAGAAPAAGPAPAQAK